MVQGKNAGESRTSVERWIGGESNNLGLPPSHRVTEKGFQGTEMGNGEEAPERRRERREQRRQRQRWRESRKRPAEAGRYRVETILWRLTEGGEFAEKLAE